MQSGGGVWTNGKAPKRAKSAGQLLDVDVSNTVLKPLLRQFSVAGRVGCIRQLGVVQQNALAAFVRRGHRRSFCSSQEIFVIRRRPANDPPERGVTLAGAVPGRRKSGPGTEPNALQLTDALPGGPADLSLPSPRRGRGAGGEGEMATERDLLKCPAHSPPPRPALRFRAFCRWAGFISASTRSCVTAERVVDKSLCVIGIRTDRHAGNLHLPAQDSSGPTVMPTTRCSSPSYSCLNDRTSASVSNWSGPLQMYKPRDSAVAPAASIAAMACARSAGENGSRMLG